MHQLFYEFLLESRSKEDFSPFKKDYLWLLLFICIMKNKEPKRMKLGELSPKTQRSVSKTQILHKTCRPFLRDSEQLLASLASKLNVYDYLSIKHNQLVTSISESTKALKQNTPQESLSTRAIS